MANGERKMNLDKTMFQLLTVFAAMTSLSFKEEENPTLLQKLKFYLRDAGDPRVFSTHKGPELFALLGWFGFIGKNPVGEKRLDALNTEDVVATIVEFEKFKARTRLAYLKEGILR